MDKAEREYIPEIGYSILLYIGLDDCHIKNGPDVKHI